MELPSTTSWPSGCPHFSPNVTPTATSSVGIVEARRAHGRTTIMSQPFTVPTVDTDRHATEAPCAARPMVLLNACFTPLQNWTSVIRRLAGSYRAVRFDARAPGRSGTSTDYSVQA